MKWHSHKLVTGVAVWSITGKIFPAVIAALGSIFPDWIEPRDAYETYQHRKGSHWFVPYLIFAALFFFYVRLHGMTDVRGVIAYVLAFYIIGCLCHILEDSICGTVPFIDPRKRVGIRLFSYNSPIEYIVVATLVVGALILRGLLWAR